jgi:hypothetical protein
MFQFPTAGNHPVLDHYHDAHRCHKCGTAE